MKRKVIIFLSLILCFGLLCVSSSAAWQVADAVLFMIICLMWTKLVMIASV